MERLSIDGDWALLAATTMPDHVHVLFELSGKLALDRIVAKMKTLSRCKPITWQSNFFEHRLRSNEQEGLFAKYIFMNPYRANLLARREKWPHWIVGSTGGNWDFLNMLESGCFPPEEWLNESEDLEPNCVRDM